MTDPKRPHISPQDATAWVSFKLVEVMAQREAVELCSLILRAAGIGSGGLTDSSKGIHSAAWDALRQANGVYGAALAEWFGMFLARRMVDPEESKDPSLPVYEVLDEIRIQAMNLLDERLTKHLEYEKSSGLPWLGEARQRMLSVITQAVRHGKDLREMVPSLNEAPYGGDGRNAAYSVLRRLGFSEVAAKGAIQHIMRQAGLAPDAVDLDRAAPELVQTDPPADAQEAAYRVLRVLGYDQKIAEGAVEKSLGFVPPPTPGAG